MRNKCFSNRSVRVPAISQQRGLRLVLGALLLVMGSRPALSDALQWMHAPVNVSLPAHDDRTDAVLIYSEINVNVISADTIKAVVRQVYKILKPTGRQHGTVNAYLNANRKINSLHGWAIPAQGKDYEVKDRDALKFLLPELPARS
jgi:hypothetical protein